MTTQLRSSRRANNKQPAGFASRQQSRKRRARFAHRGERPSGRRRDPGTIAMAEAEPIVLAQRRLALQY
ncbi:MAG: hypothetical protein U0516_04350 [Candidatus Saccharibacteria bacterium]